ncbi:hypothetical protein [Beijerinckia sp. L45]|uniref:hypothetical protein n=1 Tax=Beijerinckia sp. L45 TaxID=1641855 RepID=UPI00131D71FA|nr:hypothetical protein [Beijerinckia sp. L45]
MLYREAFDIISTSEGRADALLLKAARTVLETGADIAAQQLARAVLSEVRERLWNEDSAKALTVAELGEKPIYKRRSH